jgi:MFS family permease
MSLLCLTFKEPVLAIRLEDFNCDVSLIGIIFSLETISFTATSIALQCVKEEANGKKYGRLEYFGMIIFVVSMICYGPAKFLPDELWLICVGIVVGGVAGSLINNNSSVAMMLIEKKEAVLRLHGPNGKRLSHREAQALKSSVASINTGAFGLGSILGPILGSALSAEFGFR